LLAGPILKETVSSKVWGATLLALCGAMIILQPFNYTFNFQSLLLLASAFMFATLDIINKHFVNKESILSMMFYSALVTTITAVYPVYLIWEAPSAQQLLIMAFTGVTGNLMLYCLLASFKLVPVSHLSPFRYFELVISGIMGFMIFNESIALSTVIGSLVIISSTLIVSSIQVRAPRNMNKRNVKKHSHIDS
jgi:S-adenosylmethionine uptake transporter